MEPLANILASGKHSLFIAICLITCLLVVIAILLDLVDGLHTAHVLHQPIRSHRMRKTANKVSEYLRFVVIASILDCFGMLFPVYHLPCVTITFGVILVIIETRSLIEHARRRKDHTADFADILNKIINAATEKDARHIVTQINSLLTAQHKDSQ